MTVDSIAKNMMSGAMLKVASGNRINSAADDAAGLAIMNELEAQIKGISQGTDNAADMQNLVRTAEGGMDNISEGLQRMRELSIQAANGTLSKSDRAIIQEEIEQIKGHIQSTMQGTQFNNQNLLDGSFNNAHTASSADGSGMDFSIGDMSKIYESIKDYDVSSGKFDLSILDGAINEVSKARASLGAISNTFDHTMESNNVTMLNQAAAKSRIADADMAKEISNVHKDNIMTQFQIMMQKQNQENQKTRNPFNSSI